MSWWYTAHHQRHRALESEKSIMATRHAQTLQRRPIVVVVILAVIAAVVPGAHAQTVPPSPAVDVVDPAALEAPLAPDPIFLQCVDGQVDLNHASIEELRALPTPDGEPLSRPTAENIVGGRPYLQVTDLKAPAVPGVSTDHVATWIAAELTCVTPILETAPDDTEVPVAPDVCESGQHDVNAADDDPWFAATFGRPTAARLVDGAPYPSVVNALRIVGVGPGGLRKYRDSVCATPYPITYNGTDWAWATPGDGITVDTTGILGTYDLIVPPATTQGNGAWASITEVDSPFDELAGVGLDLALPAADPHVHGNWAGNVAVVLPPDQTNVYEQWPHAVLHWTNGTVEVHGGSAVPEDADGRVRVATDDLSVFSALRVASNWSPEGVQNVFAFTANLVRGLLGSGGQVRCAPDYTGQTLAGGENLQVTGDLLQPLPFTPPINTCTTRDGQTLDAKFGNGRGIVQRNTGRSNVSVHDLGFHGGLLWGILSKVVNDNALANGGTIYIAPGGTLAAHTSPGTYQGTLTFGTNPAGALIPTTSYIVLDELGFFFPVPLLNLTLSYANCAVGVVTTFANIAQGEVQALTATMGMFQSAFTCAYDRIDEIRDAQVRQLASEWFKPDWSGTFKIEGSIDRYLKIMKLGKIGAAVADATAMSGANGDVTLRYKPPVPSGPATDNKGRPVHPQCVIKTFSYETGWTVRIDERCQDLAYGTINAGPTPPSVGPPVDANFDFVGEITNLRMYDVLRRDAGGTLHLILLEGNELVAHPIAPEDEWNFKNDWPEDEWRSDEFASLIDRVGNRAVNDPLRLRNYLEGRGHSWLLRDAAGTAWWIDQDGVRHHLGTLEQQQAVSNTVLTYHPAQYANDICPYPRPGDTGLRVC
jgi:hypothetical protein